MVNGFYGSSVFQRYQHMTLVIHPDLFTHDCDHDPLAYYQLCWEAY